MGVGWVGCWGVVLGVGCWLRYGHCLHAANNHTLSPLIFTTPPTLFQHTHTLCFFLQVYAAASSGAGDDDIEAMMNLTMADDADVARPYDVEWPEPLSVVYGDTVGKTTTTTTTTANPLGLVSNICHDIPPFNATSDTHASAYTILYSTIHIKLTPLPPVM